MSDEQKTWKSKLKMFIIGAVIFLLFIWTFSTASSAKTLAEKNAATLDTPTYSISMLLGGPERFAESFEDIENADLEKIKTEDYMWSTIKMENTSQGDAVDVEVLLKNTIPIEKVLVSPTGYYRNTVEVAAGEEEDTTLIAMDEIGAQDTCFIFVGVNKDNIPDSWSNWKEDYKKAITSIRIEGSGSSATFFGEGYSKAL